MPSEPSPSSNNIEPKIPEIIEPLAKGCDERNKDECTATPGLN